MKNPPLTLAICSNRVTNLYKYSLPSVIKAASSIRSLILLDANINEDLKPFIEKTKTIENIKVIHNMAYGLSNLRNIALTMCQTPYILFIDDDVTLSTDAIKSIIKELNNNYEIVGLRLIAPSKNNLKKWYISPNQYHYLGIHSDYTQNCVWGACMGFNVDVIRKFNHHFDSELGRQNDKYINGEDTSFIAYLKSQGCRTKVIASYFAIHHIERSRTDISSVIKRVFGQGVTEVLRRNKKNAIDKEFNRNFRILTVKNFFLGFLWFLIFLSGIVFGILRKILFKFR